MKYKVCILSAGIGSRMGETSQFINKALLPLENKAIISHIIEKYPKDIEIVIGLGHLKETITDYLELAYPNRKFTFVDVDKYSGPGTGPGYSLLQCKKQLQCPFIFTTVDTIVLEKIPEPDSNWLGVAAVKETEPYITVNIESGFVSHLDTKTKNKNKNAFIGLAGIKDYEAFFEALENDKTVIEGEAQVSNGFQKLIEHQLNPITFTWFDTGTQENYQQTCKHFAKKGTFDFSKDNEFIYFVNGRVIKFFADKTIAKNRVQRAKKYLKGLCPEISGHKNNFYAYKKIKGQTLYDALEPQTIRELLEWAKENLWKPIKQTKENKRKFKQLCKEFYYNKTLNRLGTYYKKNAFTDAEMIINDSPTPQLKSLFQQIDWDYITEGVPSNFHGDLQFDNIIVSKHAPGNKKTFTLLDWRQDFGGQIKNGDLYYDLAKLYSGVTVPFNLIKEGKFSFQMHKQKVDYTCHSKKELLEAKQILETFFQKNNYDIKKIKIITSLIFLNLSPMFKKPFSRMAYFLGVSMLNNILNLESSRTTPKRSAMMKTHNKHKVIFS